MSVVLTILKVTHLVVVTAHLACYTISRFSIYRVNADVHPQRVHLDSIPRSMVITSSRAEPTLPYLKVHARFNYDFQVRQNMFQTR